MNEHKTGLKPTKLLSSFLVSIILWVTVSLTWTIFFDGNYIDLEKEKLTYEELFDDLSDMDNVGYVLYDFYDKRVDLCNDTEYDFLKNIGYEVIPKIKGKFLALFINKNTAICCIKIDPIDFENDNEVLNEKANEYFNSESKGIYTAYVFKIFGNYYMLVEPRIKNENGFVRNSMYVCHMTDCEQFSELKNLDSSGKPNYFNIASYPKIRIKWQVDLFFRIMSFVIMIATTAVIYVLFTITKKYGRRKNVYIAKNL